MKKYLLLLTLLGLMAGMLTACGGGEDLTELRAKGKKAFLDEDYAQAREYLLKAIAKEPSDKELLYFTAQAYRRDYILDSALFYFKRIDVLYPNDRETNLQIREIAIDLEEWEDAIGAVSVLAKTGDGYEPYLGELSDLWARTGSYINALYWARKAMAARPDNKIAYVKASMAAAQCDSMDAAMRIVDSALARFGDQPKLLANKAAFLAQQGDHREAERILRGLVAENPDEPGLRLNLAHNLAAQNSKSKHREALKLYREVVDLVPPEFGVDSMITALEAELE